MVSRLLGGPGEKKRENQMFLQSPLSGEKKVHALFFSRKKRTFGEEIEECVLAWGEALENPPGPWKGSEGALGATNA